MTPGEVRAALEALVLVGVPFGVWGIRMVAKISDDLKKVSQSVYGVDGRNGLRGDVGEHKGRLDGHGDQLADQRVTLDRHAGRLDGHDRELATINRARP